MKTLKFFLPLFLLLGLNFNTFAQDCQAPYTEPILRVEPMQSENGFNVYFEAEQAYTLTTFFLNIQLDNPDWSITDVIVNPGFEPYNNLSFSGPNMSFSWTYEVNGNSMLPLNQNGNGTLLFSVKTSNAGPWCTHVDFTNITTLYEIGGLPDQFVTTGGCEANLCETNVDCSAPWEDPVIQVTDIGNNVLSVAIRTDAPFYLHSLNFNVSFSNPDYQITNFINGVLPANRVNITNNGNWANFDFWTLNNQTAELVNDNDVLFYIYIDPDISCTWVNIDDILATEDIAAPQSSNCVPLTMAVCETEHCVGEQTCEEPFDIPALVIVPVEGETAFDVIWRSATNRQLTTMLFDVELSNTDYIITEVQSPFLDNPTLTPAPPAGVNYVNYQWVDFNNPVGYSDGMIIARIHYDPGENTECSNVYIAGQLGHEYDDNTGNDCVDTNLGKCDGQEVCLDNNDGNCEEPYEKPTLVIVPNGNNSFWVKVELPEGVQSMQIVNLSFTVSVNSPLYQFIAVYATPFLPGANLQWDANSATLTWPAGGGMAQSPVTIWDGMPLMYVRYRALGEACAHINLTSVSGLSWEDDGQGNHTCLPIDFNVCEADICDEENKEDGEEGLTEEDKEEEASPKPTTGTPGPTAGTPVTLPGLPGSGTSDGNGDGGLDWSGNGTGNGDGSGEGDGRGRRLTDAVVDISVAPNPFSNTALISFNLEEAANVKISIHDSFGRLLQVHENQYQSGLNDYRIKEGNQLPNGVLYISIETGSFSTTKRLLKIQ